MFSHIMIGTDDIESSERFYNAVLAVLGISEPSRAANGSTIGFVCNSPEQVKEFHSVAIANGATSIEAPPGLRDNSTGKKHLCYFLDLDGHKICGMYRCN